MTTHKEALRVAQGAYYGGLVAKYDPRNDKYMEAALRAYLDARGMVMVPKEATDGMIEAGDEEKISRETFGMTAYPSDIYLVMLAAAPDPFQEA